MIFATRRINETLEITDQVSIVIVSIDGDGVRLGIVAPAEVPVLRQEVLDALRRLRGGAQDTSTT